MKPSAEAYVCVIGAASAVALEHRDTVNPNISPSTLKQAQEMIHDV